MFVKRLADLALRKQRFHNVGNLRAEEVDPRLVFHNGIPAGSKSLAYDRVQKILAVSTTDGRIKLFGDLNSQAFLDLGKAVPVKFLQFVENRGLLLIVTIENHIEMWDIVSKQLLHVLVFPEEITSFSVLQQQFYIYIGDCNGNVSILGIDLEKCQLTSMQYHIPFIESHGATKDASPVVFLLPQPMAESRRLLIIFTDGIISLWGFQESKTMFVTGGCSSTPIYDEAREVTSGCWGCPYGSKIILGYKNGEIYIWSIPKLSEMKNLNVSEQKDVLNSPCAPLLRLNLIYKLHKIPVVSLKWNHAGAKAPRLYINGISDNISSFQVVLFNENAELRTVKLVLPLSEACVDMEIISGFNEQTKKGGDALVILLKYGYFCIYDDSDIENYLLQLQTKSYPELPKQLNVRIPFITSPITAANLITEERPDSPVMSNKNLMHLASRIPSLFSTDTRDGNIQLSLRLEFAEACKLYITGHQDGSISFWNVSFCQLLPVLSIKHQSEDSQSTAVTAMHFDVSSHTLVSGYENGLVRRYKLKSPQSVTESIFSFLQVKQGCSYTASSVKLDGAISTIVVNPELTSFAIGTERGYVYAVNIEEMTILYQKQFSSVLYPSIRHLVYHKSFMHGSMKNILLVASGDSSISTIEGDSGIMVGHDIIKRKNPTKALFMEILDMKHTSSNQPLILHCSEKSICLYSLTHTMQGLKKVYNKKNLLGFCCWASTFYSSSSCCGVILCFANCKVEIRSLPELNLLKETQFRGLTVSNSMASSKLDGVLCCSADGNLLVARGHQEVMFYSVLDNPYRHLGLLDQVYKNDVPDPPRTLYQIHDPKEKKMGIFGTVLKDSKKTKVKDEQEDVDSIVTAGDLSNLFSACNFPLSAETGDGHPTNDCDVELDIDDINIDDREEKSWSQNTTVLNKQLGKKFNVIKEKLKTKTLKKPETTEKEVNADEKSLGRVNEIKQRYGYFVTGEASTLKIAQNRLQENLNKLQGINLRTSEMQETARSFSAAAKELLETTKRKK